MLSRLLLAICLAAGGALSTSSALAAPVDACKLVTSAEVGAVVGASVVQEAPINGPTSSSCHWKGGAVTVVVATMSASMFQTGKKIMSPMPVSGIGDEAYQTGFSPTMTKLTVRKGANAITVTVLGLKDLSATQAAEKAVGRTAAGRM
jgi:hypothetical protein